MVLSWQRHCSASQPSLAWSSATAQRRQQRPFSAALRSIPALRRLALRLFDVPAELAACAAQLQHLTFLRLAAGGTLPAEPALLQLTRLQHLVRLELADNRFMPGEYPPLPLPAPADCSALQTYDITCHRGTGLHQVCTCMVQTSNAG